MQLWHVDEMLLLLLAVNGMPVVVGMLAGKYLDLPLDGGLILPDGYHLFGPAKTVRGVLVGVLAGTLISPLADLSPGFGAAFGGLSMLGDLSSSFLKRRLGYATSCSRPLLDQLPECLLPLLVLKPALHTGYVEILLATAAFIAIDLLLTRLLQPRQRGCR